MTISFQEYQAQALSTAVYPRQYVLLADTTVKPNSPSCIYPVFGLCGEIGELTKVLTDKLGCSLDAMKECGDVIWYIAAICSDLCLSMKAVFGYEDFCSFEHNTRIPPNVSLHEICSELFIAAGMISEATKKTIRDTNGIMNDERIKLIKSALIRIMFGLTAISNKIGASLNDIAQMNLNKLASRAARGVITGNGDNR